MKQDCALAHAEETKSHAVRLGIKPQTLNMRGWKPPMSELDPSGYLQGPISSRCGCNKAGMEHVRICTGTHMHYCFVPRRK